MAEIVHAHARLTSQASAVSSTFVTKLSISASELTTAGFAANDDVVIIYWANLESTIGDPQTKLQITYAGTALGPIAARYDMGAGSRMRSHGWMVRVDLGGTVADIDLDLAQDVTDAANPNFLNKAELFVLKLADLGTENTDWFFDTSTTDVAHTTVYSPTNRAAVTWTPASVEDWVVIGSYHVQIDSASRREEMRLNLDSGTIIAGDFSEEGESSTEEKRHLVFDIIPSLAASSHTVAVESREISPSLVLAIISNRRSSSSVKTSSTTSTSTKPEPSPSPTTLMFR